MTKKTPLFPRHLRPRRMYAPCGPHELGENCDGMYVSTKPEIGRRRPVVVIPLDDLKVLREVATSGYLEGACGECGGIEGVLQSLGILSRLRKPSRS